MLLSCYFDISEVLIDGIDLYMVTGILQPRIEGKDGDKDTQYKQGNRVAKVRQKIRQGQNDSGTAGMIRHAVFLL